MKSKQRKHDNNHVTNKNKGDIQIQQQNSHVQQKTTEDSRKKPIIAEQAEIRIEALYKELKQYRAKEIEYTELALRNRNNKEYQEAI